jgi:HTH-type transcriptional regulator, cell division transcriptional repressor
MGIKQQLGKKIKRIRMKQGLTQEKLAELIDISQRTLSGIEIGQNFLTAETLDKIINTLEITPDELFTVNHLKNSSELIDESINIIKSLKDEPEKLENIFKIISVISKE